MSPPACEPRPPYLSYFPHEGFYDHQQEAMGRIYRALQRGSVVLFEGACGTGKTLSSLAPALAVGREQGRKVVIATNVHQQMVQFQEEAALVKARRDLRVVVLKGKELLCPMGCDHEECDLRRQGTQNLLRAEKRLAEKRGALARLEGVLRGKAAGEGAGAAGGGAQEFAPAEEVAVAALRLRDEAGEEEAWRAKLQQGCCKYLAENLKGGGGEEFERWLHQAVRGPEEVSRWASERGLCGYELLKGVLADADLVICNYQHLLNPSIVKLFLGWMGCGLSEVIAIFDEAHNLEAAAREHATSTLAQATLRRAMGEAADAPGLSPAVYGLLAAVDLAFEACLNERLRFGQREALTEAWEDLALCEPDGSRDLLWEQVEASCGREGWDLEAVLGDAVAEGLERQQTYDRLFREGKEPHRRTSALLSAVGFLTAYARARGDPRYYPLVGVRRTADGEVHARLEVFACIPTEVTRPLFADLGAAVLMSATLQPFEALRRALGIERECDEMAFGLTFPPQRRLTLAVDTPPLFASRRAEPAVTDAVGKALRQVVAHTPGAVVVFFPSYQELNRYRGLVRLDAPVFVDRLGVPSAEVKGQFFEMAERGERVVLYSYLWGTLAEGVDYRDARARAVVVLGVGYPQLGHRNRAVERAYDAVLGPGKGWEYAVSAPTTRRIRQAMGRVVRSPRDFGVRVLLDRRYAAAARVEMGKYSVHDLFPEPERAEFQDADPTSVGARLDAFFSSVGAGAPRAGAGAERHRG